MKALYRILAVFGLMIVVFFYTNASVKENELLKAPSKTYPEETVTTKNTDAMPRPSEGFSTYVGHSATKLKQKLGEPLRIGASTYGFDWWVYKEEAYYILVGVEKGKVVQVFLTGEKVDAAPFKIGQTLDDVYRTTITDTEVHVKIKESTYTFILDEDDIQSRLLVMYDGVYAQLYFDAIDGDLHAVRYIDGETLVKVRPYDMTYVGDLLEPKTPSSFEQQKINAENAEQLSELTNLYRQHKQLSSLAVIDAANDVAYEQSELYAKNQIEDEENIGLKQHLKNAKFDFKKASENAAEDYVDAPEAIHGFMNSEKHRKTLLNEDFNVIGVGAYGKNYTQILLEVSEEQGE